MPENTLCNKNEPANPEAELRNHLAKNLEPAFPDLLVYHREGRFGVEFLSDGGYIEIVSVDEASGLTVLKITRSKHAIRALNQVLGCMGWTEETSDSTGRPKNLFLLFSG